MYFIHLYSDYLPDSEHTLDFYCLFMGYYEFLNKWRYINLDFLTSYPSYRSFSVYPSLSQSGQS